MWSLAFVALFRGGALRRRVFGTLRVALYMTLVAIAITVLSVQRVSAQIDEQSFKFAKDLLPMADLLEGATGLRLNGETINLSVTVLPNTPVRQVLDRVEENCRKNPGAFARTMQALAREVPAEVPGREHIQRAFETAALSREESDGQGAVLCFTSNGSPQRSSVLEWEDGDLGALGNLRYVVAAPGSEKIGEQHSTRVISLWTEGSFRLEHLAPPAVGDAPGSDSTVVPRPPRSTRVFTAEAVGAAYAVRLYETDDSPEAVLSFYDKVLERWSPFTMPGYEDKGRGFIKDAQPVILNAARDDAKTIVSLAEMGVAKVPLARK